MGHFWWDYLSHLVLIVFCYLQFDLECHQNLFFMQLDYAMANIGPIMRRQLHAFYANHFVSTTFFSFLDQKVIRNLATPIEFWTRNLLIQIKHLNPLSNYPLKNLSYILFVAHGAQMKSVIYFQILVLIWFYYQWKSKCIKT